MITLIITSPDGNTEWQHQSSVVPRVGEQITCRGGRDLHIIFTGVVAVVHYEARKGFGVNEGNASGGLIVSVYLKDFDEKEDARYWSCSCGWLGRFTPDELADHGEPPECPKCFRERLEECDPPPRKTG